MKSKILSFFFILLITLLLLEGVTCVLVKKGVLLHEAPTYSTENINSEFWVEIDPVFGVWHAPHSHYRHRRGCFDVKYTANLFGMRDPERKLNTNKPRTVVLGDSFVEGYGIPFGQRFTDQLEKLRNREHLNFGTSGSFGPTQYYLLYKTLAKKFSHDEVLIGIYPKNDFTDDKIDIWRKSGKYRPFWVGAYPDYKLEYSSDKPRGISHRYSDTLRGYLREYTYLFNLYEYLKGLYSFKLKEIFNKKGKTAYSGFYDFTEAGWQRMRFSLEKIAEEAQGKRIVLLLFPSPNDLKRFQEEGSSPLGKNMLTLAKEKNFQVINLLPFISSLGPNYRQYFNLPCDKHFSPRGHKVIAEYIQQKLDH